ncbi:S41 family peptidase [Clostridium ljungdahlii]
MDVINKEDVQKLVIDLRNNGGGVSTILNDFIKKISKSKMNQNGKIYVIIGRKTFSSAVLNVIDLKKNTKAIFVGEPTSGKPNHYGEVKKFKLPNSGLTIKYSTKHFNNYDNDDSEFIPDKEITASIKDYINNVDPVMDYIIKGGR